MSISAIASIITDGEMISIDSRHVKTAMVLLICLCLSGISMPQSFADPRTDDLLARTGRRVEQFWEKVSSYNCREFVLREKLQKKGRAEYKQRSEFDYVAFAKVKAGALTVEEVRLPLRKDADKADMPSLLETNGFPTLLLIFHPRYQLSYRYRIEEGLDNEGSVRVRFEHIRGAGSTSAVMVQGKAYALELQGTAIIDSESGAIRQISASLMEPMKEINVEDFEVEVTYDLQRFPFESESRWLPSKAMIELRTGLQHWRNTHQYSHYKRFTVEASEAVEN
jgi:hypothetical protein